VFTSTSCVINSTQVSAAAHKEGREAILDDKALPAPIPGRSQLYNSFRNGENFSNFLRKPGI